MGIKGRGGGKGGERRKYALLKGRKGQKEIKEGTEGKRGQKRFFKGVRAQALSKWRYLPPCLMT